ncbi:mu-like prophage FluMu gp41 family protein [Burkholderia gladioli]|uniref:Mu-like prophage FluMu gp41 family protein n=1 Tax=Burkholderia gladioli TaxID=28095 RepID=A0AAW3EUS3_BURGA|nr:phage tail assembly protein [Burkholderia gladioli]AJW97525.1 mu-like prophage FluMu gp41 family protein [Burkholderia gladioli]ASD80144.1 phage tail assembly protein [Burkholderia gladioli pv. gladioli]AWY54608.1 phage tail assembly protein [Burkholderia gladioli pv. gladioli]KGC11395.1 mu-like prophage FluMu gp41 family protein [Burkholderia gladioli]MDN7752674.1 phage tail assembly protein [Burkholderia gladioli]
MDKVTVTLAYPIKLNGVECDKFTMRRPKVRDMRGAQKLAPKDEEQQELILFASLAEVSPDDIEEMDMADYARVQDAYYSFRSVRQDGRQDAEGTGEAARA